MNLPFSLQKDAWQVAKEGGTRQEIRAVLSPAWKREKYIEGFTQEAANFRAVRNVLLGIPWGQIGTKISVILEAAQLNRNKK